jgi:hypothetical protein
VASGVNALTVCAHLVTLIRLSSTSISCDFLGIRLFQKAVMFHPIEGSIDCHVKVRCWLITQLYVDILVTTGMPYLFQGQIFNDLWAQHSRVLHRRVQVLDGCDHVHESHDMLLICAPLTTRDTGWIPEGSKTGLTAIRARGSALFLLVFFSPIFSSISTGGALVIVDTLGMCTRRCLPGVLHYHLMHTFCGKSKEKTADY